MTILELENLVGLDRATIRFYEKEGLLNPSRRENSYRDYSADDAQEVLKIKLLRQLDVPIETIRNLQQGSLDISNVLRVQASALESQISEKERAASICKEMSAVEISYKSLDATRYLDKLKEEPKPVSTQQQPEPAQTTSRYYAYVEYHPFRRFFARMLDYALLRIIVSFFLVVVLRIRPYGDFLSTVVDYGCLLLSVPLQAWMLNRFATTPGKWLMGIRVQAYVGNNLSFSDAIQREWITLFYGYGFGIPIVRLWRLYKSYTYYRDSVHLEEDSTEHMYVRWNVRKKSVLAVFCAILLSVSIYTAMDMMKPKYRGTDLTVSQFAENFNFCAKLLEQDFTMNPDGTWYVKESTQTGTVIILGGNAEKEGKPLCFETEGERVTCITYENAWTDVFLIKPIDDRIVCAVITAIMSQENVQPTHLYELAKILDKHNYDASANITFKNIVISWTAKTENCVNASGLYLADDENKPSRLEFSFEIIINEN